MARRCRAPAQNLRHHPYLRRHPRPYSLRRRPHLRRSLAPPPLPAPSPYGNLRRHTLTCTATLTCAATPTYITTQMNDMPLDLSQSVLQVQTPMAEAPLSPPSCTL